MKTKVLLGILVSMTCMHTYASELDSLAVEILYGDGATYPHEKYKISVDVEAIPYLDHQQSHGLNLEKIFEDYKSFANDKSISKGNEFLILVIDYIIYYYEYNQLHFRSPLKYRLFNLLLNWETQIIAASSLTSKQLERAVYDKKIKEFRSYYYKKIADKKKEQIKSRYESMKQNGKLDELF